LPFLPTGVRGFNSPARSGESFFHETKGRVTSEATGAGGVVVWGGPEASSFWVEPKPQVLAHPFFYSFSERADVILERSFFLEVEPQADGILGAGAYVSSLSFLGLAFSLLLPLVPRLFLFLPLSVRFGLPIGLPSPLIQHAPPLTPAL
jgi:hypothetical protein